MMPSGVSRRGLAINSQHDGASPRSEFVTAGTTSTPVTFACVSAFLPDQGDLQLPQSSIRLKKTSVT